MKEKGKGREGKGRGRGRGEERRGGAPHKCWNLGPQLPRYATGVNRVNAHSMYVPHVYYVELLIYGKCRLFEVLRSVENCVKKIRDTNRGGRLISASPSYCCVRHDVPLAL